MKSIPDFLKIKEPNQIVNEISEFIKETIFEKHGKKGAVIGISGGIDSAVTAGLCSKILEQNNVLGVILPEKESEKESENLAKIVMKKFNIKYEIVDITNILESFGVYEKKESIVKEKFTEYDENCKYRVVVPSKLENNIGIPFLEILDSNNNNHKMKISAAEFLTLTAATSIKHRVRMTMLYYFAEKNNFSVIGTTNKSEFQQGYFVKYGDGGTDIEPLVNLYKSQIYQIGNTLNVPEEICKKDASPDVWSFPTTDEEFFYSVPYEIVDLILYGIENNLTVEQIQKFSDLSKENIEILIKSQEQKLIKTKHMREMPYSWKPNI